MAGQRGLNLMITTIVWVLGTEHIIYENAIRSQNRNVGFRIYVGKLIRAVHISLFSSRPIFFA